MVLVTIQIKSLQQYFYMVPFISSDFTKIKSIFLHFFSSVTVKKEGLTRAKYQKGKDLKRR